MGDVERYPQRKRASEMNEFFFQYHHNRIVLDEGPLNGLLLWVTGQLMDMPTRRLDNSRMLPAVVLVVLVLIT